VPINDNTGSDALISSVNPSSAPNADTQGMWGPVAPWSFVALHASLLPTGNVLTYGASVSGGIDNQNGIIFDQWSPLLGLGGNAHYSPTDSTFGLQFDSFCSTSKLLPDGTLLIAGGNGPAFGRYGDQTRLSHVWDPINSQLRQLFLTGLTYQRWYASMVRMPDDTIVITGGGEAYAGEAYSGANVWVSRTPEAFTPGIGWRILTNATSDTAFGPTNNTWWYPKSFVGPDGAIFGISYRTLWRLDPSTSAGSIQIYPQTIPGGTGIGGPAATAVLYDTGKILLVGGGQFVDDDFGRHATNQAVVIDINSSSPQVFSTSSMTFARNWSTAVALPDGKVLVSGGAEWGNADNVSASQPGTPNPTYGNPAYWPEIWNPATGGWTIVAPQTNIRVYHSTALLLPNGAILSAGSGDNPTTAGDLRLNRNAQVYYPPYLFTKAGGIVQWANRPRMTAISPTLSYGANFTVLNSDARSIQAVNFISLGAVTHSHNSDQRLYKPTFTQSGNQLSVAMPGSANLMPPGWYMLHIVDTAGVPSRGYVVEVKKP
jgi:Domain of unknown function (DUF1929)